jgi:hypothetical protein
VGMTANTNVASGMIVSSYSGPDDGWLPKGLNVVTSTSEFVMVEQLPLAQSWSPSEKSFDSHHTTQHRGNSSTIKMRRMVIKQPRG